MVVRLSAGDSRECDQSVSDHYQCCSGGFQRERCSSLAGTRGNGVAAWLALAALLAFNAVFLLVGSIQTRRFSPGTISGILLSIPLAIYGYVFFLSSGRASDLERSSQRRSEAHIFYFHGQFTVAGQVREGGSDQAT